MTNLQPTRIHRRHYTTGLVLVLIVLFLTLYALIKPLSSLDTQIVEQLPKTVPGLFSLMKAASTIGSPAVMVAIAVAWAIYEFVKNRRDRALVMLASLISAPIFFAIKELVHRHRPASAYVEQIHLHSYSFPSGHSAMSFAILLTLAYLVSLRVRRSWSRIITTLALLIVVLIGISRVYLQVHFPTDVIGGWLIGAIVLLLIRAYVAAYEAKANQKIAV